MKPEKDFSNLLIRGLKKGEPVPYYLLLLADPSRELIEIYLQTSEVYLALINDVVVGSYVLFPIESNWVEIKNIAVEEELQGKGIGKYMLQDAMTRAKNKGYSKIIIGTGNSSVGQLYLYQKMGFELTGIKRNFFLDNYPEPLYENGVRVKHMLMLERKLQD